jgi:hypothetical protein
MKHRIKKSLLIISIALCQRNVLAQSGSDSALENSNFKVVV